MWRGVSWRLLAQGGEGMTKLTLTIHIHDCFIAGRPGWRDHIVKLVNGLLAWRGTIVHVEAVRLGPGECAGEVKSEQVSSSNNRDQRKEDERPL